MRPASLFAKSLAALVLLTSSYHGPLHAQTPNKVNFSSTVPAAPAGGANVQWQNNAAFPVVSMSAYTPGATVATPGASFLPATTATPTPTCNATHVGSIWFYATNGLPAYCANASGVYVWFSYGNYVLLQTNNLTDVSSAPAALANLSGISSALTTAQTMAGPLALGGNAIGHTSTRNIAVGSAAGAALTSGTNSVAIGFQALGSATVDSNNTAVGMNACQLCASGAGQDTAVGAGSLGSNTTGDESTSVGYFALSAATYKRETAIGSRAAENTTTGQRVTALGWSAMINNVTGNNDTAVGYESQGGPAGPSLSGANADNTSIGNESMSWVVDATGNTASGSQANEQLTGGANNTSAGYRSMQFMVKGNYNTTVGANALNRALASNDDTAVGQGALSDIGTNALTATSISGNGTTITILVANTLSPGAAIVISGTVNWNGPFTVATASGSQLTITSAMNYPTETFAYIALAAPSGSDNTALGFNTGRGIVTGTGNTIIGANVTGLSASLTNNIILADGTGVPHAQWGSNGWINGSTTADGGTTYYPESTAVYAPLVGKSAYNGFGSALGEFWDSNATDYTQLNIFPQAFTVTGIQCRNYQSGAVAGCAINPAGGTLQVGQNGSAYHADYEGSATLTYTTIATTACQEQPLTITNAVPGDTCHASTGASDVGTGFFYAGCRVSAAGTAQIKLCAATAGVPTAVAWTAWARH